MSQVAGTFPWRTTEADLKWTPTWRVTTSSMLMNLWVSLERSSGVAPVVLLGPGGHDRAAVGRRAAIARARESCRSRPEIGDHLLRRLDQFQTELRDRPVGPGAVAVGGVLILGRRA
jgi:hypothetical protein